MERLSGQSVLYQWMNLAGALGIAINGWWHHALPSTTLNIIWLLIGAYALWRIWTRKGSSTSAT
jgi:hypothetical protein